jgi:GT2 family glycosyltransferase
VRVVVVDNASTDGSVEYLREAHPDAEVIALDRNQGYAGGANVGLRAGSARYAFVMNADVLLRPDHLERLVARLEADPGIGAAQGKLYRISPTEFDAVPYPGSRILDSAGHRILRSRMVVDRGSGRPDGVEYSREASVFSVCGAAIFLRRAMLEDLSPGGEFFDESFFAYKEDIDLCWRARLLGWDIRYVPDAIGYHVRSWAGEAAPPKDRIPLVARRHSWVNHYVMLLKNDRVLDLIRWGPWVGAWEVVRQGYALLRDPALYGEYVQLMRRVPEALRQRRDIFSRRRSRPGDLATWFTVDSQPVPVSREAPVD